jgi:hypothetical protein
VHALLVDLAELCVKATPPLNEFVPLMVKMR